MRHDRPLLDFQEHLSRQLVSTFPKGPDRKSVVKTEIGEPAGVRTLDLLIKSQLLYQLSYRLSLSELEHAFSDQTNGVSIAMARRPFGMATSLTAPGRDLQLFCGDEVLCSTCGIATVVSI